MVALDIAFADSPRKWFRIIGFTIMSGENTPSRPDPAQRPPTSAKAVQLSATERVPKDVNSVALNGSPERGFLAMAAVSPDAGTGTLRAAASATLDSGGDAQIMLRVKAGDDDAFDYLVQKYRRPIIHFMYRATRTEGTAEELAQEVFLRVYRSRQTYEASAKFTTWLYRIATNLSMNYARDTKHERPENMVSVDEKDEATGLGFDVPDASLSAEQNMMRRERLMAIRERVLSLPDKQRNAVLLHKYQAMDYRQIAEVLKLSESATKSLLFRAYETLREQLKAFV